MERKDREIGLDGSELDAGAADARRIGEKLLFVDELEDTLEQVRGHGESPERIEALERRLSSERETIQGMETRGELRYEEIARVMDTIDRSG